MGVDVRVGVVVSVGSAVAVIVGAGVGVDGVAARFDPHAERMHVKMARYDQYIWIRFICKILYEYTIQPLAIRASIHAGSDLN
jgi:hypothetical protein